MNLTEFNDLLFAIQGVILVLILFSALVSGIGVFYVHVWKNRKLNGFSYDYLLDKVNERMKENKQIQEENKHTLDSLKEDFEELNKKLTK